MKSTSSKDIVYTRPHTTVLKTMHFHCRIFLFSSAFSIVFEWKKGENGSKRLRFQRPSNENVFVWTESQLIDYQSNPLSISQRQKHYLRDQKVGRWIGWLVYWSRFSECQIAFHEKSLVYFLVFDFSTGHGQS